MVVRDGALPLDESIAGRWKAYRVHGKGRTVLRRLPTHRAVQPRFAPDADGLETSSETPISQQ
ncbi:hypothetical protein [Streptomyces sp. NBC_01314]|uniref:hypothetical protein n=1 Tax=Streptomyces sp. NBC_01314 TaxID=2903821 RepID=UPI00309242E4|nr:hypothetical protein OG622_43025 [Streptomyces sp. NBC_01314]